MKILVAFDGSRSSMEAISVAENHAKAFGGEIILACSMVGGQKVTREEIEDMENRMEYEKKELEGKNIPCETAILVRGLEPGEDIVNLATEKKVDEIVIGVVRRSKVGKFLFGSTAQYVILQAPMPVVCVK